MFERHPAAGERRAVPRQSAVYRLDVLLPAGGAGCLLDLSTTGMRLRFKHALDASPTQVLRLQLPRWLELGSELEVRGRFVWVRSMEQGGTEAGFAFDGLSRKESSVLAVLVQRLSEALAEDQLSAS